TNADGARPGGRPTHFPSGALIGRLGPNGKEFVIGSKYEGVPPRAKDRCTCASKAARGASRRVGAMRCRLLWGADWLAGHICNVSAQTWQSSLVESTACRNAAGSQLASSVLQ